MNPFQDFKSEIKVFFIVAAVAVVLAVAGIFLLQAGLGPSSPTLSPSPQPQTNDTENFTPSETETPQVACLYGALPKELYLDTYTVQGGDTLLSIANHKLGSTARIDEIINLNKNRGLPYHSLYSSDVIVEGWELYLPAEFLPPNSGELVAKRGRLRVNDSSPLNGRLLIVAHPDIFPTGTPTSFASNARFFGVKNFQEGDCVMIIRDEGTDEDIVLAPQAILYAFHEVGDVYSREEVVLPIKQASCFYDFLGSEEVLNTYTVRKGDTLYSIARDILNDGSRVSEIRGANEKRYVNLKTDTFIEIGWELLMPPTWARSNDGSFSVFLGVLVEEDGEGFWVASDLLDSGRSKFRKESAVKYFGKEGFAVGDCVAIFNTRGKALGIASQDDDYIRYFKSGE